jgi:uncharacterized protein (DUF924 family)
MDHRSRADLATPDDVLAFWRQAGPDRWFSKDEAFDQACRERFLLTYEAAARGDLNEWELTADGSLALVLLLDQFPRNMFRGTPLAFATDALALAAARHAIASGYDRNWLRVEKIFGYLPFEHSEALADQQLACELMRPLGEEQYDYAVRHKDIIERFGRFPHRNAILGRESTPEEIEFLKQPGSGF